MEGRITLLAVNLFESTKRLGRGLWLFLVHVPTGRIHFFVFFPPGASFFLSRAGPLVPWLVVWSVQLLGWCRPPLSWLEISRVPHLQALCCNLCALLGWQVKSDVAKGAGRLSNVLSEGLVTYQTHRLIGFKLSQGTAGRCPSTQPPQLCHRVQKRSRCGRCRCQPSPVCRG